MDHRLKFRLTVADKERVAPYQVLHDKTLKEIAIMRPKNLSQLAFIRGFSPARIDRHGAEIMKVVPVHTSTSETAVERFKVEDIQTVKKFINGKLSHALVGEFDVGVDILTIADQDYPALLRQVKNPPPIIYKYGQIQKQDERSIAIVGSRNANEKGLQIARGFGKRLAKRGYTIVSGYAKGIDTESHLGALEGDIRTIMVLSTGMLHFKLRDAGFESFEFLKQNGAVISEMFPTESWTVGAAMARNRLVVGLSKAVLVVECGLKSGTMNAAHVAQQMNRPLFVLQYQEVGEHVLGNEELLKSGAIAVRRFRDVKLIEKYIASS